MNITCNGSVEGLTVAGQFEDRNEPYPEFQVWRPTTNGNPTFIKTTRVVQFPVNCSSTTDNVYTCSLNYLPVQEGDIIGVIFPRSNRNFAAFQIFCGPNTAYYSLSDVNEDTYTLQESDSREAPQPLIYLDILRG